MAQRRYSSPLFLIDTSEEIIFFHSSGARSLEGISALRGFVYYILDVASSSDPGIHAAVGPYKYAELLGKKKLEERGEIAQDETFVCYKKIKEGKNKTKLIYNLLPSTSFEKIKESYNTYAYGMMVFDNVGITCAYLEALNSSEPVAVICESSTSTIMVVGKKKDILLLRRYGKEGLLGFAEEDASGLIEQDLNNFQRDRGISVSRIVYFTLISRGKEPSPPQITAIQMEAIPYIEYEVEKDVIFTSLPHILKSLSPSYALFGREEKWLRPLEKGEKFLWGGLVGMAILAFVGFFALLHVEKGLNQRSTILSREIKAYERSLNYFSPRIKGTTTGKQYRELLNFSSDLIRSQSAPSYARLWKMLYELRPRGLYLTEMDLSYDKTMTHLDLLGEIPQTMLQAQQTYSSFISNLKKSGFKINNQKINLGLNLSTFMVELSYAYNSFTDEKP